jgi:hypothetical protein
MRTLPQIGDIVQYKVRGDDGESWESYYVCVFSEGSRFEVLFFWATQWRQAQLLDGQHYYVDYRVLTDADLKRLGPQSLHELVWYEKVKKKFGSPPLEYRAHVNNMLGRIRAQLPNADIDLALAHPSPRRRRSLQLYRGYVVKVRTIQNQDLEIRVFQINDRKVIGTIVGSREAVVFNLAKVQCITSSTRPF